MQQRDGLQVGMAGSLEASVGHSGWHSTKLCLISVPQLRGQGCCADVFGVRTCMLMHFLSTGQAFFCACSVCVTLSPCGHGRLRVCLPDAACDPMMPLWDHSSLHPNVPGRRCNDGKRRSRVSLPLARSARSPSALLWRAARGPFLHARSRLWTCARCTQCFRLWVFSCWGPALALKGIV
eukprot:scaffold34809_cov20-Tisochrysis_lutea.AAC.1